MAVGDLNSREDRQLMKASIYNLITTHPDTQEKLLFNTLTTSLAVLSEEVYEQVKSVFDCPTGQHNVTLVNYLSDEGFLVAYDEDEFQKILTRSALGINDQNRLDVLIMPNMNCNLACTYCYEKHHKSSMTDETARRLKLWLMEMVPKFKAILVSWFGGEPMLSYKRIVELQGYVYELTKLNGVEFISHMTTNGYSLRPRNAKILTSLGLHSYQITLDGTPNIHNSSRPLKNGGQSFDRILENIITLARIDSEVNIKLRVNYNNSSIGHIPEMLEMLPVDIRSQLDLVMDPIFGEEYGNYSNIETKAKQDDVERIYQLAISMGFAPTAPDLAPDKLTYCYADRKNQFLINYNGDIFKCTVDDFSTNNRMGWLNNRGEIQWEEEGVRVMAWQGTDAFDQKCSSCLYAPMCMGGCRKMRVRYGTVGEDCTLPFEGIERRIWNYYSKSTRLKNAVDLPFTKNHRSSIPVWIP